MAVSTSSYFSNAIQGIPGAGAEFSIFDKDTTPKFALGIRYTRQDGNVFIYSHFGADVNRGVVVSTDASESSVVDTDNVVVAPASAQTVSDGTIGNKFVEITLASVIVNQYAGAYFAITDNTGEGFTYRVRGNTATGDPTSGNFRLELYDPLQVALDATTDIAIQGSLYANLEISSPTDVVLAGIAVNTMDVSEQSYGWVLAKGVTGILSDGTTTIGSNITLSDGVSGAIQTKDAETEPRIGYCLIAGDTTGHAVCYVDVS